MSLQASNLWIAICLTFISVCILAFVIGILVAVFQFKKLAAQGLRDARPAINQATDTLKGVSDIARTVEGRVDHIMHIAEDTADNISRKVRTTSSIVTDTISPPLITVSSLITGVSRGLEMWSSLKKRGGNGREAA